MILLLALLLQEPPVERYLAEKDKAVRGRILAEIQASVPDVEAALRLPPKRPPVEATGQIVKRKIRNQRALGVDF